MLGIHLDKSDENIERVSKLVITAGLRRLFYRPHVIDTRRIWLRAYYSSSRAIAPHRVDDETVVAVILLQESITKSLVCKIDETLTPSLEKS